MKTSFAFTRPARTLAPLALAAALTGCSMAPKYDRPAAPIDTAYPLGAAYVEPAAATPDDAITAEIGWRDFFRDPLLQQLIGISLENNRDMRKAALNVEAAQALYRIQRAEMLPNLGVSARGASERVPADLSTTGQSDVLRRYDVAGVTAAWELDLWGRIRSLSDRALASYLALDETRIATQMSLVSEVASAYLTLRADQELLRLTSDTLATQKRSYGLTTQLVEAGNSTQLDLRRAEIALRTAEANHAAYTRQAAKDRNALVLLVGTAVPDTLGADLLGRRPDVVAARWRVEAATQGVNSAKSEFYPNINIGAFIGLNSLGLDRLFNGSSRQMGVTPALRLPIFDGGRLRAQLGGRAAELDAAIAQYNGAVLDAVKEAGDAVASIQSLTRQQALQDEAVASAEKAYRFAQERYRAGLGNYLVVLSTESQVLAQRRLAVDLRARQLDTRLVLMKALGGGWTDDTAVLHTAAAH